MEQNRIGWAISRLVERNRPDLRKSDGTVNQSALAKEAGIQQPTLSRLMSGVHRSPRKDIIDRVAEVLHSSPAEVRGEVETPPRHRIGELAWDTAPENDWITVPVLEWEAAIVWDDALDALREGLLPYSVTKTEDRRHHYAMVPKWLLTDQQSGYMLPVVGDLMAPLFPDGAKILVDPKAEPKGTDFVITIIPGEDDPVLRQWMIDGSRIHLKPLNPMYPVTSLGERPAHLGVVRRVTLDLK